MTNSKNSPALSVCLITKNEENYIDKCLDSIKNIADQIVVVDTGSEDNTLNIVSNYNADIYHIDWQDDFSVARNETLDKARGEWILQIDADEVLENKTGLPSLLDNNKLEGYLVKIRNLNSNSGFVKYNDDLQLRLFRNRENYEYRNKIHEQIAPSIKENGGEVLKSELRIDHYGYIGKGKNKAKRNLPILEQEVEENPSDPYLNIKLGENYKALGEIESSREYLKKALELPGFSSLPEEVKDNALMRLAQVELHRDNYESAVKYTQMSLNINPENEVSRFILAVSYTYLGEINKAGKLLKELNHNSNRLQQATLDKFQTIIEKMKQVNKK